MADNAVRTPLKVTAAWVQVAYNPYPTSVGQKVQNLGKLVVNGIGAVLNFIFSVPGRLAAFAKLSRAERIETYKGWWQAIKKEAHHYWVRTSIQASPSSTHSAMANGLAFFPVCFFSIIKLVLCA